MAYQLKSSGASSFIAMSLKLTLLKRLDTFKVSFYNSTARPERFESLGVEVIFGSGEFVDQHTFKVNGRHLKARAVIATGSRPAVPPIPGLFRRLSDE